MPFKIELMPKHFLWHSEGHFDFNQLLEDMLKKIPEGI